MPPAGKLMQHRQSSLGQPAGCFCESLHILQGERRLWPPWASPKSPLAQLTGVAGHLRQRSMERSGHLLVSGILLPFKTAAATMASPTQ